MSSSSYKRKFESVLNMAEQTVSYAYKNLQIMVYHVIVCTNFVSDSILKFK